MSKKAYVGINGISKNVKNIYVGVNGVPKKVVKGYVGVNGVARLFWDGGTPPTPVIAGSWDFWTTTSGFKSDLGITKTNNGIAYYAAIHTTAGDKALLISPMSSAVEYGGYTQHGYIVDSNNITWWINATGTISNYNNACLLSDTVYGDMADAARDLVSKIYAVPFQSDYQSGQTYTLYAADQRKTLRKVYSTYLHRNVNKYASSTEYRALSDNADTIINTLINTVQSYSASGSVIGIGVSEYEVTISYGTTSSWGYDVTQIDNASLEGQSISNNYKLYRFSIPNPSYPEFPDIGVYPDWETTAQIDSSGQITYDTLNGWDVQITGIDFHAGVEFYYYDKINLTNIGIDL